MQGPAFTATSYYHLAATNYRLLATNYLMKSISL